MKKEYIKKITKSTKFPKLNQFKGKIRRIYLILLRKKYVNDQLNIRKGECIRCGACCKFIFECPFLKNHRSLPECKIHNKRPPSCKFFPIDDRDINERNQINPKTTCGYFFKKE